METWEVTGRTEETVTITYKRRVYKEETFPQSTGKSQGKKAMVDKETKDMLKRLSGMSKDIRKKYRIEKKEKDSKQSDKKNKKNRSSQKPEDLKSLKDDSEEEDHINVDGVMIKKGAKGEPCDHRGVPLSHPMAMTPYPGASTAAQREKARKMLKEIARQMHEEDLKKQGIHKKAEKSEQKSTGKSLSGTSNLTSQTSDLSSISSAATSSKASGKSSKSKSTSKSSKRSVKSTTKNSRSSNKKMGCDKCGSCQKCIHRCSQKHAADVKVTEYEREQFLNGIKRLRKKIVKPEKSRERATKSPYDVTQSESELELTSGSSSKSAKTSKKSSAEK
ncbi:hypothetical protein B9Z55_003571 [Caenorhabditis nigoni]|nr:hypothetical protein B9Z55_003571 [Caenorhabditis nigoni]